MVEMWNDILRWVVMGASLAAILIGLGIYLVNRQPGHRDWRVARRQFFGIKVAQVGAFALLAGGAVSLLAGR